MFLLGLAVAGCASKPPRGGAASQQPVPEPVRYYDESTASALVFDPPVTWNQEPLDLSRDERAPSAFVGFDGPIITYYWIHTDDWQGSDWGGGGCGLLGGIGSGDCFQRRALIDKVGVSYR